MQPITRLTVRGYIVVVLALLDGGFMIAGQGFVVALGYRIVTVLCAALGIVYYLTGRREVAEAIHEEAEAEQAGEI